MSSSSTSAPGQAVLIDVTMPQMGVSVVEGTVVAWRVEVGDRIEADQTICEISTDKIDTEVPSPATGVVAEIVVPVETTVSVGEVLARIAPADGMTAPPPEEELAAEVAGSQPDGEAPGSGAIEVPTGDGTAASGAADGGAAAGGASGGGAAAGGASADNGATAGPDNRRYSPVVQRIAAEHGVDLSQISGTGRGGRVRKQDVLAFVESSSAAEAPLHIESPYRPDPTPAAPSRTAALAAPAAPGGAAIPAGEGLSRMRRQIGQHMKRSLETAATCTTWIDVDMGHAQEARSRLGVTALSFVARATIDALREHPALNAWLEDDRYTRHSAVNLGIAVSLGDEGLIVPVIHNAHELSVEGLAARIKDLARRARSRQLTPDDVQGGTFTITNPGQYGSIMATPIINQPQVAILDLEAIRKQAVVLTDAEGNDSIAIRPMTIVGLSWDHRALDGVQAAQFLATVKRNLEGLAAG
ncbi:MAG: 2-oxo acid dehydrogenase subunit E2 [Actinomycetota bacterium]|nr:2-oxo acid dehydrogenase subunit E2 [Actinomycetota bacterium]